MSMSNLCLVKVLYNWMSLLVRMMFLWLGLSGLGLLSQRFLMLIGLVVGPFLPGYRFWKG